MHRVAPGSRTQWLVIIEDSMPHHAHYGVLRLESRGTLNGRDRPTAAIDRAHVLQHFGASMFSNLVVRLKRRGWMIPFVVVLTAGVDYLRKEQLSITGLLIVALMALVFVCTVKFPSEA